MANKADAFFFENLAAAAEYSYQTATYLVRCLSEYDPENINMMLVTMHEYEHSGDTKKHEMSAALAKAFVTPIEREDLALISQNIDDVTDGIEEILQRFYMYRLPAVTPEALQLANKLVESCDLMRAICGEFHNFKRPGRLHELVIEINRVEEECDALYMDAFRGTSEQFADPLEVVAWRDIYTSMENCADACEHVGDSVDLVVMKNN